MPAYSPNPNAGLAEVVRLSVSGGKAQAFFVAPSAKFEGPAPLLIFMHGNAELADGQHACREDDARQDKHHSARSAIVATSAASFFMAPGIVADYSEIVHPSLAYVHHRPWPLPARPWLGRQTWCDLLFAHWPVPVASVRHLVPASLEVDVFDRQTWIGIVPFRMEGVMLRGLPNLPWISAFPELNLRLYVTRDGKPGVWFLSLDAANPLAVWAARRFVHLPYEHATMTVEVSQAGVDYRSLRRPAPVAFEASYRPTDAPYTSKAGSLEHWLTERYCLYAQDRRGRILRCEVHHRPWPLQRAEAAIRRNDLLKPHGVLMPETKPLLHFAKRVEAIVWKPDTVLRKQP